MKVIYEVKSYDAADKPYVVASHYLDAVEVIPDVGEKVVLRSAHQGERNALVLQVSAAIPLVTLDGYVIVFWIPQEEIQDYRYGNRLYEELAAVGFKVESLPPALPRGADADDFDED